MKNKIKNLFKILVVTAGCLMFASFSPSLDGRAVVVDDGVFPQGLFAKTVGYLPGDIISVTNIAGDSTVDILVIGALDPSEGVAIMLSPEAAQAMGIEKGANNIVKITKRSGQEDRVYGNAVISKSAADFDDNDDGSFESIGAEVNSEAFEEPEAEENMAAEEFEEETEEYTEPEPAEEAPAAEETEEDFTEETEPAEEEFTEEPMEETEESFEEEMEEAPLEEASVEEEVPVEEEAEEEAFEEAAEEEFIDEAVPEEEFEEEALPETEEPAAEEPEAEDTVEEEAFEEEPLEDQPEEKEYEAVEEETLPETEEAPAEEEFVDEEPEAAPALEETTEPEPEAEPEASEAIEEEPPVEEETLSEEAFVAEELDELPAEEKSELVEEEEYEAIVLVPADSNPPEAAVEEETEEAVEAPVEETAEESVEETIEEPADTDEVEDLVAADELDELKDEVFNLTPVEESASVEEVAEPAPAKETTSYDKYIVPSLKDLESGKYYIQIAVYGSDENILEVINKYGNNYPITIVPMAGGKTKQILVGPVTMDEYKVVLERFKSYGFKDAFLRKVR